jgi:SEC-C motif-containing protein
MSDCPCGSGATYAECCGPLVEGRLQASTAETLMRARYSAYALGHVDFILETTDPGRRAQYDRSSVETWSRHSTWHGLEVLATEGGGPDDPRGVVEFVVHYSEKNQRQRHHEIAEFVRRDGRWYFLDGQPPKPKQVIRSGPKVGRNDPCPCGSGRKYKKCCAIPAA